MTMRFASSLLASLRSRPLPGVPWRQTECVRPMRRKHRLRVELHHAHQATQEARKAAADRAATVPNAVFNPHPQRMPGLIRQGRGCGRGLAVTWACPWRSRPVPAPPFLPGALPLLELQGEAIPGHLHPLEHLRIKLVKIFSVSRTSVVPELNPLVKGFPLLETKHAVVGVKKDRRAL